MRLSLEDEHAALTAVDGASHVVDHLVALL
jgi:hypothetical protein